MRCLLIGIINIAMLTSTATASPLLELMGTPTPDRPFGGRSSVNDGSAAYFNPARLSVDQRSFTLTYLAGYSSLDITSASRPSGYDIPESIYQAKRLVDGEPQPLTFRPLPTADTARPGKKNDESGLSHNVVMTLSMPLVDGVLSVGMTSIFSVGALQKLRPSFADERAQFFDNELHHELYGDRLEVTTFILGIAYQPTEYLRVGIGVTMLNNSRSIPEVYIPDAADQEEALLSPAVDVEPIFTPHFGAVYRPLGDDEIELSTSVHLKSESRMTGQSELTFWKFEYPEGQTSLNQPFAFTFLHEPLRASLGAKWVIDLARDDAVDVYGDLTWSQWSTYTDRVGSTPRDWEDVVAGHFGARWQFGVQSLAFGMAYTPSPVPEQTGRTNYVDNSRLGAQIGWKWTRRTDSGVVGIGLGLQAHHLLSRSHWKDPNAADPVVDEFPNAIDLRTGEPLPESAGLQTNNPGFPGFEHGGWIIGGGVTVSLEGTGSQ